MREWGLNRSQWTVVGVAGVLLALWMGWAVSRTVVMLAAAPPPIVRSPAGWGRPPAPPAVAAAPVQPLVQAPAELRVRFDVRGRSGLPQQGWQLGGEGKEVLVVKDPVLPHIVVAFAGVPCGTVKVDRLVATRPRGGTVDHLRLERRTTSAAATYELAGTLVKGWGILGRDTLDAWYLALPANGVAGQWANWSSRRSDRGVSGCELQALWDVGTRRGMVTLDVDLDRLPPG